MSKNNVIFILFVAALLGSTWGAVVNRQKIDLEQQLGDARAELRKLSGQTGQGHEGQPGKTAGVRESLAEKEEQLAKTRKELAQLRKEAQALEARLAESTAAMQELAREKDTLAQQLKPGQVPAGAVQEDGKPPGELQIAGLAAEGVQQRLDEVNAQLLGLEKIVDEKNAALQEAAAEKERLQINMDVLLAKIADQQRELQAVREENRELVKQLAVRNEMADLQEKQPPDKN